MFQKRPRDMLSHTFCATHYLKTERDVGREVERALSLSLMGLQRHQPLEYFTDSSLVSCNIGEQSPAIQR